MEFVAVIVDCLRREDPNREYSLGVRIYKMYSISKTHKIDSLQEGPSKDNPCAGGGLVDHEREVFVLCDAGLRVITPVPSPDCIMTNLLAGVRTHRFGGG